MNKTFSVDCEELVNFFIQFFLKLFLRAQFVAKFKIVLLFTSLSSSFSLYLVILIQNNVKYSHIRIDRTLDYLFARFRVQNNHLTSEMQKTSK